MHLLDGASVDGQLEHEPFLRLSVDLAVLLDLQLDAPDEIVLVAARVDVEGGSRLLDVLHEHPGHDDALAVAVRDVDLVVVITNPDGHAATSPNLGATKTSWAEPCTDSTSSAPASSKGARPCFLIRTVSERGMTPS